MSNDVSKTGWKDLFVLQRNPLIIPYNWNSSVLPFSAIYSETYFVQIRMRWVTLTTGTGLIQMTGLCGFEKQ